jgi:hypothetical protein
LFIVGTKVKQISGELFGKVIEVVSIKEYTEYG